MKTPTKTPKKEAACLQLTAEKTKRQYRPYLKAVPLSSLKLEIGNFLLYLQRPLSRIERQICWQDFESTLRKIYQFEGIR